MRTERWAGLVKAMSRDMKLPYEEADKLAPSSIPLGRIAEVEEVANLVVMLASPLMHMVNGTMIEIDGGQEKSLMDRAARSQVTMPSIAPLARFRRRRMLIVPMLRFSASVRD